MNLILKTLGMFVLCYAVCAVGMSQAHADKFIIQPEKQEINLPIKMGNNSIDIDVPQTFMGIDNLTWEQVAKVIRDTEAQTITLRVTGYGGDIMTGNIVIRAIEDAQKAGKTVIMDVIGPAYSMHAYITCFANHVKLRDGAALMFHQGASYGDALFGLIEYATPVNDQSGKAMEDYMYNKCLAVQRLYPADLEQIKKGNAVVIANEQGNINTYYTPNSFTKLDTIAQIVGVIAAVAMFLYLIGKAAHVGSIGWHRGKKR